MDIKKILSHAIRRPFWVGVHRYAGLYIAFFLIVAGLTGSVLAFLEPLKRVVIPELYAIPSEGRPLLDPLVLHAKIEALDPRVTFTWVTLHPKPHEAYGGWVTPKIDSVTKKAYELEYEQLYLNPYTGREIRRIPPGNWHLRRDKILDLVYGLHYSLAIPGNWGTWLFGIAAVIWSLDCFVGLLITLPSFPRGSQKTGKTVGRALGKPWLGRWWNAWKLRFRGPLFPFQFQWHRALGLWTWFMLFIFAWSGVAFNLGPQVYSPVMKLILDFESPWDAIPKLAEERPMLPVTWESALETGRELMGHAVKEHHLEVGWEEGLGYVPEKGIFIFAVHSDRDISSWGGTTLYFDAVEKRMLGFEAPTGERAGTTFTTWITSIHMGSVFGFPMKVLVGVMGLVIAVLSVSGVYIYWKKLLFRRIITVNRNQ